jgi:hypothetical protein
MICEWAGLFVDIKPVWRYPRPQRPVLYRAHSTHHNWPAPIVPSSHSPCPPPGVCSPPLPFLLPPRRVNRVINNVHLVLRVVQRTFMPRCPPPIEANPSILLVTPRATTLCTPAVIRSSSAR